MGRRSKEEDAFIHMQMVTSGGAITHKYGIRIPKTVKEAVQIDKKNGDTRWWDAILQEMKNVRPAFEAFEGNKEDLTIGF